MHLHMRSLETAVALRFLDTKFTARQSNSSSDRTKVTGRKLVGKQTEGAAVAMIGRVLTCMRTGVPMSAAARGNVLVGQLSTLKPRDGGFLQGSS